MARPHRVKESRNSLIIRSQEKLALDLLDLALKPEITADIKLDVFDKVGRWVAIKNRVEETEETDIDRFKRRIQGETQTLKGRRGDSSRLDAIRAKLPSGTNGSDGGDSDDPVSEAAASS